MEPLSPTCDLMKEHGLLNRILLIFNEYNRRLDKGNISQYECDNLMTIMNVIQIYLERHHEIDEEKYIFPFIRPELAELLYLQHVYSRKITILIISLLANGINDNKSSFDIPIFPNQTRRIIISSRKLLQSCLVTSMQNYRKHEVLEDTIAFPEARKAMSSEISKELTDKFEESEHRIGGFDKFLKIIKDVENNLGMYRLDNHNEFIIIY